MYFTYNEHSTPRTIEKIKILGPFWSYQLNRILIFLNCHGCQLFMLNSSKTYSHHSLKRTVLLNNLVWNFSKNFYQTYRTIRKMNLNCLYQTTWFVESGSIKPIWAGFLQHFLVIWRYVVVSDYHLLILSISKWLVCLKSSLNNQINLDFEKNTLITLFKVPILLNDLFLNFSKKIY